MSGSGTFSKYIDYVGGLTGALISGGSEFTTPEINTGGKGNKRLVYCGNRVNLYVLDAMTDATKNAARAAGISLGIEVGWSFNEDFQGVNDARIREINWHGATPVAPSPLTEDWVWQEAKIEYAGSDPGSGLQLGELSYDVYMFPAQITTFTGVIPGRMKFTRVIPIVARADYMRVFFWASDAAWTGAGVDAVRIWALSGSDVAGSQRIGGGHG